MNYQSGRMREIDYDNSPSGKSRGYENEFHHTQRSKYEKSQVSYAHNQRSKVHYEYEGDKTDRFPKNSIDVSKDIQKSIPFKIRSPDHEDRYGYLHVQMNIASQKNLSTFTMHFTDDKDSLFLWSCYVRESEFSQLKSKLSLRVDFHGFPEMINELLEYCVDLEKDPRIGDRSSYFFAVFEIKKDREQADFRILEANKYKESEHFQLTFKRANDDQLKRYLSKKYDEEKGENHKLNRQISQITDKLNRRIQEVQTLSINYENMQKDKNERISDLEKSEKEKIKREVLKIEEEKMREQKEEKLKNERKFQQMTDKIKELTEKCYQMNEKNSQDHKKIIDLEQSERTLMLKCTNFEKQVEGLQQINNNLKKSQIQMNKSFHDLKNQNTRLSCTIESLEQRMKERDARLAETNEQKSTNSNQISGLQEQLRQQKKKIEKLEEKNQNLEEELNKVKRKNQDLSGKYQKKKDKLSDYVKIIKSQQTTVEEKQKQIKRFLSDISQIKMERERMDIDMKEKDTKIQDLKVRQANLEEEIQNLKKSISRFHKQKNEKRFDTTVRIPSYSPLSSAVGRDYSNNLTTSTSTSRIKFTQTVPSSLDCEKEERSIALPIKKYREGVQNDRNRENSRSPIVNRLNQQKDPEEMERPSQKIGPIKFRK